MKNKSNIIYLFVGIGIGVILTFFVMTLFNSEASEISHNNEPEEHEELVELDEQVIVELGILINEVSSQNIQTHIDLTGEIVPEPYNIAHIVPRFSGIVKTVHKKIGDRVKKGEIIAIIESNESLSTYDVKSSINGVVLELHMTPGELIGDDKHVVTIADLSTVWAELNIYQKDLKNIKVGQNIQVYFDDINDAVVGNIFYLSPTVDEHTRTATARVQLRNIDGIWKPGMFVTAKVLTNFIEVDLAVEVDAIQNFEGQKVVFVKDNEGFRPQSITLGKSNTKYVEVLSGLSEGDLYIAQGAFAIKSELLKESFGGHGH